MQMDILRKNINLLIFPMFVMLLFSLFRESLFFNLNSNDYFVIVIISPLIQILINALNLSFVYRFLSVSISHLNKGFINKEIKENTNLKLLRVQSNSIKISSDSINDDVFEKFFQRQYSTIYGILILVLILVNITLNILCNEIIVYIVLISIFILIFTLLWIWYCQRTYKVIMFYEILKIESVVDYIEKNKDTEKLEEIECLIQKGFFQAVRKKFKEILKLKL